MAAIDALGREVVIAFDDLGVVAFSKRGTSHTARTRFPAVAPLPPNIRLNVFLRSMHATLATTAQIICDRHHVAPRLRDRASTVASITLRTIIDSRLSKK